MKAQKETATRIPPGGCYLCRRRPTLPHTFACSTIGPAGLDFRVRDGNGYFPRGKITGFAGVCQISLAARSPASSPAGPGTPIFQRTSPLDPGLKPRKPEWETLDGTAEAVAFQSDLVNAALKRCSTDPRHAGDLSQLNSIEVIQGDGSPSRSASGRFAARQGCQDGRDV